MDMKAPMGRGVEPRGTVSQQGVFEDDDSRLNADAHRSVSQYGTSLRNHSKESVLEASKALWVHRARQRSVYAKEMIVSQKRAARSRPRPVRPVFEKRKRSVSLDEREDARVKRLAEEAPICHNEDMQCEDMDVDTWEPPVSPYGLLEEEEVIFRDPWKLFLACILLNRTTAVQVRRVVYELLNTYPTPEAILQASENDLERLIQPLGMYRKRAVCILRVSRDYLSTREHIWRKDPTVLFGVGMYASDAFKIFCLGDWQSVTPEDKDLRRYVEFLSRTEGVGVGFRRDG